MHKLSRFWVGAGLLLVVLSSSAFAQDPAALQEKLDQKLAKEFVKNAAWEQDYDKAKAAAAKDGKVIFAYFTRSYAP